MSVQKTPMFAFNKAVSAKNAMAVSVTIGAMLTYGTCVYAEEGSRVDNASASTVMLPAVKVDGERDENAAYSGSAGQVSESNHAGFLGNKDALDTPFSAISYTDKYIDDVQAMDVIDVISATDASVYTNKVVGENLESYSIRGFSANSNDVTVNGLSGMAPYYRSATQMYERVEVLKGPSAMLNGMAPNGSVGGAINLVTKRAGEEPLTRLTTKYLSDSQLGASLDVSRRFGANKAFGVRVNGAYLDGETSLDDQDNQSGLGSIGLDWRGERVRLSADLYSTQEKVEGPTRGITVASGIEIPSVPDSASQLNPSWAFYDTHTEGAMARGEFDVSDNVMLYAALGANKMDYKGLSASKAEVFNSAGDMETTLGYVADDNERVSMEVGLNSDFKTGNVDHQIATNITHYNEEYNLNALRYSETYTTNIYSPVWGDDPGFDFNTPLLLTTETNLTSFGLADTLSFDQDTYQLTLGARYQEVKTEQTGGMLSTGTKYDESATTPSIAFVAKLSDQVSLYANYIEGLSKGATAPTSADNSGEIFAPYETQQTEIGLKFDQGNFTHTLSVYEIEKPDSYTDTDTNLFGYYGEQRNRGVEWGFFGTPIDTLRLMGGITYLDAKITSSSNANNEGNRASGISKWQAKLGAEWDTSYVDNLTVTANATAMSKRYLGNDNEQSLPGNTVFGLGARYKANISDVPVTLRANIDNVTDKSYWSMAHYNDLALGEGRTLTISAAMDF